MCTYVTRAEQVSGSGLRADGEWFSVGEAVVYFDHPQNAPLDHALCIDFRGAGLARAAVELDAPSARRVALAILAILEDDEVAVLTP